MVSGAAFLAGDDPADDEAHEPEDAGAPLVWAINERSVQVFSHCRLDLVAGMAVIYNGIAPAEIRATLDLLRIEPDEWPDLLDDVQFMGRAASAALNERNKPKEGRGP